MKKMLLLLAIPFFLLQKADALPLPNGATAPNFTMTDIFGVSHTLYDYLDEGKMVVLEFSATWCGPCWNYHSSNVLKNFYNQYGPPGTDEVMVLFIEGDPNTPVSALYGGPGSQGDWVTGTPFPIIDDATGQTTSEYQITFFPTLYAVCPDRKIYLVGQAQLQTWVNWISSCSLAASAAVTNAACAGQPSGSINLTATGGHGSKTYQWSNGANTEDVFNLLPGNYAVTVTEGQGRSVNLQNIVVGSPPPVNVQTVSVTNVNCPGAGSGSATVAASGGTPGFSYQWSNGATGATASNLSGGTYQVTATDLNGCQKVHSVSLSEPPALLATPQTTPANCGNSDGLAIISPQGGTPPYTFNIGAGNQFSPIFQNLSPGNYTVTLTDGNGCNTPVPFVIGNTPGPVAAAEAPQELNCSFPLVSLDGTASASGNNITYLWTTATGNIISGANTTTPVVDEPGTYTLTVTNTQTGCETTDFVDLTQDLAQPESEAGPNDYLNCGSGAATLDGSASSQGQNFTYEWTTPNGLILSGENSLSPEVGAVGTYQLAVTNTDNGCVSLSEALILENIAVGGEAEALAHVSCNGGNDGEALATALQGVEPFTYSWPGGGSDPQQGGLSAGIYLATITDAYNCAGTVEVEILQPSLLIANASASGETSLGAGDGTASANPVGGVAPYQYAWSNGATTETISGLTPGAYSLTLTDVNGCTTQETVTVNSFSCAINASAEAQHISCKGANDGAATVEISFGLEPFTILWSNGSEGSSISGLAPGTYTASITDENNCPTTVNVSIVEPEAVSLEVIEVQNASCFGNSDGQATVAGEGGVGAFSYAWSSGGNEATETEIPAGSYSVTLTDGNGCQTTASLSVDEPKEIGGLLTIANASCAGASNGAVSLAVNGGTAPYEFEWSTGQTGTEIEDLPSGAYQATVVDANNCIFEIEATVLEPEVLVLEAAEIANIECEGQTDGSATLAAQGGTPGYSYEWSTGETGPTASGLTPGFYQATVTDANNCSAELELEIAVAEDNTLPVIIIQDIILELDENGEATITTGMIDAGSFDNCGIESMELSQYAFDCSMLGEQEVSLSATDVNGNQNSAAAIVTVVDLIAPQIVCPENITALNCDGLVEYPAPIADDNCGVISVLLIDGLGSGANFPLGETTQVFKALDASGNAAECSFVVKVINTLEGEISAEGTCPDLSEGSASLDAFGGTPEYAYIWSTGDASATVVGLIAGTYSVTVTDATGCAFSAEIEVEQYTAIELSIDEVVDETNSGQNGAIRITASAGTAPFTYEWRDETGALISTDEDLENVGAGVYTCLVIDANGCEFSSGPITVESISNTQEPTWSAGVKVFPNPAKDQVFVRIQLDAPAPVRLEVFDVRGVQIAVQYAETLTLHQMDLASAQWPSGVYYLRLVVGDETLVRRVVVE